MTLSSARDEAVPEAGSEDDTAMPSAVGVDDVAVAIPASAPCKACPVDLRKPAAEEDNLRLERRKFALEVRKFRLERRKFALEEEKNARSRWWHEDQLVNHRLTWLLTSQGLLFAGLFVLVQPRVLEKGETLSSAADALLLTQMLPIIGIFSAFMVLLGTGAARCAQVRLARDYKSEGKRWTLGVWWLTSALGRMPSIILPLLFIVLWAFLGGRFDTLDLLRPFLPS